MSQGTWSIKERCRSDGIFTFSIDGKDPNPCATWSYWQLDMNRFWHSHAKPRFLDGLRLGQLAWSEPNFGYAVVLDAETFIRDWVLHFQKKT